MKRRGPEIHGRSQRIPIIGASLAPVGEDRSSREGSVGGKGGWVETVVRDDGGRHGRPPSAAGSLSKHYSRSLYHGQRAAAIEDGLETLPAGTFLDLIFFSLRSHTSLPPIPSFPPSQHFTPPPHPNLLSFIDPHPPPVLLLCVHAQTFEIPLAPISSPFLETFPRPQTPGPTLLCTVPGKGLEYF